MPHSPDKFTLCAGLLCASLIVPSGIFAAGPYATKVGTAGTTAISKDSTSFVEWATGVSSYTAGTNVSSSWQTLSNALGKAQGTSTNILCLGDGGSVVLTFADPITNGTGYDFAVFENSFSDTFLELGYVDVSTDGINWVRFESDSLTASSVSAYGSVDCTNIDGLAGKYKQGYGTQFDLSDLVDVDGVELVDLTHIYYVRIVDIVGDGTCLDSDGDPIYDPYGSPGASNGFDLDAVGVLHLIPEPSTYAAIMGLGVLGLAIIRKKKLAV